MKINKSDLECRIKKLETEKDKLKFDIIIRRTQAEELENSCKSAGSQNYYKGEKTAYNRVLKLIEQFEKETKITMDKNEEFYKKLNKKLSENKIILYKGYEVERIECEVERTFRDEPMGHTGKNRKISMKKWITYTIYFHIDGMPGSNKVDELNPDDFEFKDPGEK